MLQSVNTDVVPEDFAIGYEVLPTRQDLDMAKGIMVIPNPSETIEQEGFIYLWNFYAMVAGKLIVQVGTALNKVKAERKTALVL